jgi:hypothetical protein
LADSRDPAANPNPHSLFGYWPGEFWRLDVSWRAITSLRLSKLMICKLNADKEVSDLSAKSGSFPDKKVLESDRVLPDDKTSVATHVLESPSGNMICIQRK